MQLKRSLAHETREYTCDGIEEVDGKGGDSSIEVVENIALDTSSCKRIYQKYYCDCYATEGNKNRECANHQQYQYKATEAVWHLCY